MRFTVQHRFSTFVAAATLLASVITGKAADILVVGCDLLGIEFTKAFGFVA